MKSILGGLTKAGLVAAALVAFTPAAYANSDWSFNALGLDATFVVSNGQVIGITGSVAGFGTIDSLIANVGSDPGGQTTTISVGGGTNFTFDDLFFTTGNGGMHLDGDGVVFKLSDGQYADLWENSAGNYELFIGNYLSDVRGEAEFAVPEPSSIWPMLTGALAFAGLFLFRRSKKAAAAFAAV
jgi:hypothetical protein